MTSPRPSRTRPSPRRSGDVAVQATEEAETIVVAFGIGVADKSAVGGSVSINVTHDTIDAHISQGSIVMAGVLVLVRATDTFAHRILLGRHCPFRSVPMSAPPS